MIKIETENFASWNEKRHYKFVSEFIIKKLKDILNVEKSVLN